MLENVDGDRQHKDSSTSSPENGTNNSREESFPIPLTYIDVIRSTHTDLHVAQEKRIDDYWNVDGNRNLSDSWTGFTRSTLLNESPPRGYVWSRRRLTKIQTTSRPDQKRPDVWIKIGKAAQRREKQEWAIEKPKLEHARKMRGIYSIDPSVEEHKDIIQNAKRKLETPNAAAVPCKRAFSQASTRETGVSKTGRAKTFEAKTRFSCIPEAHESTRQKIESVTKRIHEEHIAGKGQNSVLHYNLVHKFIPMLQAMKIPDAEAAVDKEWKKLETIPAWDVRKVKSKKEVIKEAQKNNNKVRFASLMDLCHLKNSELEPQFSEVQRKGCASRRYRETRLWSLCSVY